MVKAESLPNFDNCSFFMNRKFNPDQAADKEWRKGGVRFWDVFCGVVERIVFLCPKLYSINARDISN